VETVFLSFKEKDLQELELGYRMLKKQIGVKLVILF